jgi:hypothetical protein
MGRRQHVILILMKIKDLPGIGSQEKRDSGDGARILQNCSLLTSFLPWLPPNHFCQATSLASLGGSHGKLRRVDAKAT